MNLIGKNILQSIENEIKQYCITNKNKTPSYTIINEKDTEQLLNEMCRAKLIPDTKPPKKIVIYSQRVIRTIDIPEGYFDIVGG